MEESLYFEDFEVGILRETQRRVVTQDDVEAFAAVSGDMNPLHLDEAYASETEFGGRIAHGLLGLSIASGLLNRSKLTSGTLLAFLGLSWEFRKPLLPGTSVRLVHRVLSVRGTRRQGRGIVVLGVRLLADPEETLQEGEFKLLVKRRETGADRREDQTEKTRRVT